jgi:hypothetical protein
MFLIDILVSTAGNPQLRCSVKKCSAVNSNKWVLLIGSNYAVKFCKNAHFVESEVLFELFEDLKVLAFNSSEKCNWCKKECKEGIKMQSGTYACVIFFEKKKTIFFLKSSFFFQKVLLLK